MVSSPLLFFLFVASQAIEIIEIIPEQNGGVDQRKISMKMAIRLLCKGPGTSLSWEFNGGISLPVGTTESVNADSRVVEMQSLEEEREGIYSCSNYDSGAKKRVRLYYYEDIMPAGFHDCSPDQMAACANAKACRAADDTNRASCVCMKDWQGEKCDVPEIKEGLITSLTSMPLLWIILSILLIAAVTAVFKCHNNEDGSERIPTEAIELV